MGIKKFERSGGGSFVKGDRFPTGDHLNKPVYIHPLDVVEGLKTEHDPEGVNPKIRAHVYDLEEKQAYANCIFFNGAVIDGMVEFLGEPTVVRFVDAKKKNGGKGTYRAMEAGTDADYALAESMEDDIEAALAARVAELEAEAAEEASLRAADAPKQNASQAAAVKGAFKR